MNLINSNPILIILVALITILGFIISLYVISRFFWAQNRISSRLEHFIGSGGLTDFDDLPENKIVMREMEGSLFKRTVAAWFRKILQLLGKFTPQKMVSEIDKKLTAAGNPRNLRAREFYAIRMLSFFVGIGLAYYFNQGFPDTDLMYLIIGVLCLVLGAYFPNYWLNNRVKARQDEIQQNLPDALDMLSVCATAGLGFDQSLQKVSSYWDTVLGLEFRRVSQEMEMGISRSTALRNMAQRVQVKDISRFVALIVQAERVGMSYADVLHSQAIQMRVQRQTRARELANKLPGKMILPIAIFIFPALLAVILGPSLPLILDIF